MVEVWLPYGKTEVHVSVPLRYLSGTIEPATMELPENPFEVVTNSLENPIDSDSLLTSLNNRSKISIALDGSLLPITATIAASSIVWYFEQNGIPKENVTLVVGNTLREGSHPDFIESLRESESLKDVIIYEHSRDSDEVIRIGGTSRGTDVTVAQPFATADYKIAVGETSPDYFAGMKGAQSTIMPGLSSSKALLKQRELAFQSNIVVGQALENPVHIDQMEACKLIGIDFAIQLVTDGWGRISSSFTGGLESCWNKALETVGESYRVNADPRADIIVVSAGGSRFDFDLYNAVWALQGISPLVKRGATIIFLAECTNGLGAEGLESLAQVDTLAELRRRYALGARAVYAIKTALRGNEVILVSALPSYQAEPLGFNVERTANAAFQKVLERRRNRRTLVITHGISSVLVPLERDQGDNGENNHTDVN
jgi:nickel-dependent lactate racemase